MVEFFNEVDQVGKNIHFIKSQNKIKINYIVRSKSVWFFDNINSKTVRKIKNLLCPIYYAYHKICSNMFVEVNLNYNILIYPLIYSTINHY